MSTIKRYWLWVALLTVLALLLLARFVVAAQDRAIKPGPVRVIEMTITPSTDMGRQLTRCPVVAKIQIIDHLPSGEVRVIGSDVVHFDLVTVAGQSVLVSGNARTYRDIAESLYAAILQEHENGPGPLPDERRRAPRSP